MPGRRVGILSEKATGARTAGEKRVVRREVKMPDERMVGRSDDAIVNM